MSAGTVFIITPPSSVSFLMSLRTSISDWTFLLVKNNSVVKSPFLKGSVTWVIFIDFTPAGKLNLTVS